MTVVCGWCSGKKVVSKSRLMLGGEVGWRVSFQFESQAGFMPLKSIHRQVRMLHHARDLPRPRKVLTISHEDIIIVMKDVLCLPLEWIEVTRRLLIHNSTSILDINIPYTPP